MNAIILAGGEGTRLRSIWSQAPKPMIPLLGKPLMERLLGLLRHNGIKRCRCALRYMPGAITEYFGDGGDFGLSLSYNLETAPLGTAGCVKACRDFYGDRDALILSGDALCDFDLRALMEYHRRSGASLTMALSRCDCPTGYGLVICEARGRVQGFIEKPSWERVVTDRVNTGIYVLSPRAMDYVPEGQAFDFARDLIPRLLAAGETVSALSMPGYWNDVGTPRAYYQSCLDALDGRVQLYDREGEPIPPPEEPSRCGGTPPRASQPGLQREIPCAHRARLMALLTERALMEAGADFSDGLRLPGLHIAPAPDREALILRADSGDTLSEWARRASELGDFV